MRCGANHGWWLLALFAVACGDDGAMRDAGADAAPEAGPLDAARVDVAPPIPDGAVLCEGPGDCDDGVECTLDICDPAGFCRNRGNTSLCDDGVFCNGTELCDLRLGCMPGGLRSCDDGNVCTIDRCDEGSDQCVHDPRDFDEDGEADFRCEGGTDCDDFDPLRASGLPEICDDGIDNDCDAEIDEPMCGIAQYDTCDDPLDVSEGGQFVLSNGGAGPDYALTCASLRRDIVAVFEIEEPRDVRVEARGPVSTVTAVALRTTCASAPSEIECASGRGPVLRRRSLAPGTYFVVVSSSGIGDLLLDVGFADPSEPPSNESCAVPLDVSSGGQFEGSFVDVADDLYASCSVGGDPDLVYTFRLDQPMDVIASVTPQGDVAGLGLSLRSTCDAAVTEVRCTRGSPLRTRFHSVPSGRYYLVLEAPAGREPDFLLEVRFEPASAAPPGDTCESPLPLPPGVALTGSFSGLEDDINLSCGAFYRDAVYAFQLSQRSDVVLQVDAGTASASLSLRTACGDEASERRCRSAQPLQTTYHSLEAGTYYVIVESALAGGFTLEAAVAPVGRVPVEVAGNDDCASAFVVPRAGGLFRGDTSALTDGLTTNSAACGTNSASKDAVFRIDLTQTRRLVADTDGSAFNTVLHLHRDTCVSRGELYCDDDGGADSFASRLDEVLTAGTYYLVVDGWGSDSVGPYDLQIDFRAP